jgi:hypothetical protein
MTRHRNPRPKVPKRPTPDNADDDLDGLLHLFRDHVARADAFLTAAEDLIERPARDADEAVDEDADDHPGRRRNHVAHLLDAAKLAVRAAVYTSAEIDRRRGTA